MNDIKVRKRMPVFIVLALLMLLIGNQDVQAQNRSRAGRSLPTQNRTLRAPVNVTGTWLVTVDFGSGMGASFTLRLRQIGTRLIVSERDDFGSSRGVWVQERDGRINGNKVTFSFEGRGEIVTYRGTVKGNIMKGTV